MVILEGLLPTDAQRKWLLEMETTTGEKAVNSAEMTIKDLESHKLS